MDFENEKNHEEKPATEQSTGSREGYSQTGNSFQRDYRGRSPRPRIHTGQRPAYTPGERPSYNRNNDEGGFRPEGFGAGLQSSQPRQSSYRPRNNYNNSGNYGYGNRGGYQPRQQPQGEYGQQPRGGYRPRYSQDGDEQGYQPRQQGGYQPRQQGGYQPRQQGGYQQARPYGQKPYQQGGYGQKPYGQKPYGQKPGFKKRPRTADYDPNEPVRLNKFLANAGVCSRREADEFIQAGVVTVNGQVVTELGTKILRTDEVHFHDQLVSPEKKVYVLLNKPKDYVTTSDDPQQRKTVMDLVKNACPERIYPVGRLDRNTTGVLLLTNDGDLASKLTQPKYLKKKIYHVYLDKNVTAHDLQAIAEGIQLEDGEIKADDVQYADAIDKKQVGIEIHSGKNRIVRRIFESLGYRVLKLDRVQFAGLTKKNLRRGDWRFLTEKEVEMLRMGAFE